MKKLQTSLLCVAVLALLGQAGQASVDDMISYWRFDEPAGDIVCDSVGYNYGIIGNDPQRVAGIVNGAMRFDGVDDYVEVADDASLDLGTSDFSIVSWVKLNPNPSCNKHAFVVKRQVGPPWPGYSLFYNLDLSELRGQLDFGWPSGPVYEHTTVDAGVVAGSWCHVVWAVDRTNSKSYMYVNGSPTAESPDTITANGSTDNSAPLYIGAGLGTTTAMLDGVIDEVAIYSRVLTSEEIQENYENGLGGMGCFPSEPPVTYEGDTLLSTEGAATADAYLAATLQGCDGGILDIDGEEVTFVLTAEGVETKMVSTITVAGIAATTEPLSPAIYDIEVTLANWVTTSAILVVYNPEGGFVTGGGWIDSPAGAYAPDASLTGKANFGFVSKYKKGATTPTGQTEFVFKTADLNFHSSSYQWLVVNQAGTNAQFKGEGTINGAGSYKFMLWAGDSDPDTFRIRIWEEVGDSEIDVYDNGTEQPIGGGSIVVHAK